ncbi:MAG: hypothetical protein JW774_00815 [Candidatus Aureabacteria bacterium]|nr:hypothetical protein [Candidatus Auribacterota bacterium]
MTRRYFIKILVSLFGLIFIANFSLIKRILFKKYTIAFKPDAYPGGLKSIDPKAVLLSTKWKG